MRRWQPARRPRHTAPSRMQARIGASPRLRMPRGEPARPTASWCRSPCSTNRLPGRASWTRSAAWTSSPCWRRGAEATDEIDGSPPERARLHAGGAAGRVRDHCARHGRTPRQPAGRARGLSARVERGRGHAECPRGDRADGAGAPSRGLLPDLHRRDAFHGDHRAERDGIHHPERLGRRRCHHGRRHRYRRVRNPSRRADRLRVRRRRAHAPGDRCRREPAHAGDRDQQPDLHLSGQCRRGDRGTGQHLYRRRHRHDSAPVSAGGDASGASAGHDDRLPPNEEPVVIPRLCGGRPMKKLRMLVDNERGVALMLALVILLTLTGLVLAFLSVSAFEPQISRNQSDTTRARFVADAGIEYAYDTLASNLLNWNNYLVGATCTTGAVLGAANTTLPGLSAANGTFTVRVRNDCNAGDNKFTGVVVEAGGNATNDTNNKLIVTSVGTFNGTTKTITVVISKTLVPSINAALAFPGIQADVNFNGSTFVIDGRDTRMADTAGNPTGTHNAVYGITTNPALPMLETQVENALANNQGNNVTGRDETSSSNPPATTAGANTIQGDNTLTSQMVTDFAAVLKKHADIMINTSASNPYSIQSIGGGTGTPTCTSNWSSSTCWGSTTKPKIVYINGTLDNINTQYTSLNISGTSEGTGILIIENGNTDINGNFRWNGPVITTGRNVGLRYLGGGYQSVYGATVVNELHNDGTANLEGDIRGNANLLYSKEALDLVQNLLSRRLVTTSSWTDQ